MYQGVKVLNEAAAGELASVIDLRAWRDCAPRATGGLNRDVDRAFEMLWSVLVRLEPEDSQQIGTAVRMLYDAFGEQVAAARQPSGSIDNA